MDPEDLNFPCQELSNCGLGIALALLVHRKIGFFVCVSLIGNPAVSVGQTNARDNWWLYPAPMMRLWNAARQENINIKKYELEL